LKSYEKQINTGAAKCRALIIYPCPAPFFGAAAAESCAVRSDKSFLADSERTVFSRKVLNELSDSGIVPGRKLSKSPMRWQRRRVLSMQTREDLESARVLKLESEARRLQTELSDALETVSIMKSLFAKYVKKPQ